MEIKDIYNMDAVELIKWESEVEAMPNSPDIIEQILSPGQTMLLNGEFQIGKTNELFHLLNGFTHEGCYWHGLKIEPCPALYIGWEGHPKKILERLDKIRKQYDSKTEVCPGYFKMIGHSLYLNTEEGREEYKNIVAKLNPKPAVVLLDPLKRTVKGNYSIPHVAQSWIEGVSALELETGITIIAGHHTNKITYIRNQPEDTLSSSKVKGAQDLLDGVNSAILFGKERGNTQEKKWVDGKEYKKTTWITFNKVIKAIKAKDAHAEIPMLKVDFNRNLLRLAGQEWVVNQDGTITVEDELI